MEEQLLQAALEFYHTDTKTQEIDILRDKAIFWETRARELEKKYTALLQDNSSKDDTIHHLNALLSQMTEERDNLCSVKDKLLSLSVTTGLEEQLLKAKLHIAKLKEQQDDNEVLITQLKERIKNRDDMISKLRSELASAEQSTGEIRPPSHRESTSRKLFSFRNLLGRHRAEDRSARESISSSYYS